MARGLSAVAALRQSTMELVFPATCLSCGADLGDSESRVNSVSLCGNCYESLDLLHEPMCRRCGAPLPVPPLHPGESRVEGERPRNQPLSSCSLPNGEGFKTCYRCGGRKLWFDETLAAGIYKGMLRKLVLRMKTDAGDGVSLAMGHILWQSRGERLKSLKVDVVAPIPLHWRRRLAHRTNSASVLAEVLAARMGVPLAEGLLRRRRHTQPQSELTPPQRWENVRRAFSVGTSHHLRDAHVLVVDDIMTTGATCSEAARALRKAGAERVTAAVVSRAIG